MKWRSIGQVNVVGFNIGDALQQGYILLVVNFSNRHPAPNPRRGLKGRKEWLGGVVAGGGFLFGGRDGGCCIKDLLQSRDSIGNRQPGNTLGCNKRPGRLGISHKIKCITRVIQMYIFFTFVTWQ